MVSCIYTQTLNWIACLAVQHTHSLITSLPASEHDHWPSFSVSFHVMVMVLNLTLINFLLLYTTSRQRKLLTRGQGHTQTSLLALKRYFLSTVCILFGTFRQLRLIITPKCHVLEFHLYQGHWWHREGKHPLFACSIICHYFHNTSSNKTSIMDHKERKLMSHTVLMHEQWFR
jgi:hypothetical protein